MIRWQCSLLSLNKEFHLLLLFCTNLSRQPFHSLFLLHVLSFARVPDTVVEFVVAAVLCFLSN